MSRTKLIVGLGNPGKRYEHTFHNLGFLAVDLLCKEFNLRLKKLECRALTGMVSVNGIRIVIAKPQTYMNLSGESVRELMGRYKVDIHDLCVVYDDIDIERAVLRIRKEGSAGTHNGMRNIIYCLDDDVFPRMRIGVGRPPQQIPLHDFVLMNIPEEMRPQFFETLTRASEALGEFIKDEPMDKIMQRFNG